MNVFFIEVEDSVNDDGNKRIYPFKFFRTRKLAIEESKKIRPIPEKINIKKVSFDDREILFKILTVSFNANEFLEVCEGLESYSVSSEKVK